MFGQVWGILEVGQKSWISSVIENTYYASLIRESNNSLCSNHFALVLCEQYDCLLSNWHLNKLIWSYFILYSFFGLKIN
jgi:hypothetical protein